jgi:two-component system, OmpR family, sensor kinase
VTSTRVRLTTAYAGLLFATMIVFAAAVYFARREAADEDLAVETNSEGALVLSAIRNAQQAGAVLTRTEEQSISGGPVVSSTPELRNLLEPLPGYFIVIGTRDKALFSSAPMRLLSRTDLSMIDSLAATLPPDGRMAIVALDSGSAGRARLALLAVSDTGTGPNITRVVVGLPTSVADLPPQLLIGSILLLAPVVFLLSLGAAYLLMARAFQPVELLINEVEAITDGRSLHRRLPTESSDDELARLSETLNQMIGRLEASFGALRRFTADASHELKTPLTVLRADVERAMHPGTTARDRAVALEEAMQETARMADLVDSLLTLARADEGRFDLHREPVQLEPLVREVSETATILGEDAGLTVTLPLVEDAVIAGDRARLRQLFLNLITNAIKYTPRGGKVEMTLSHRLNNEIAFTVRDTGIGISAADLPHVFDRFWRADRVRSRASERGGFGLGLAIAQWIAQAHGGTLTVQSRLGRGSTFTVLLPMVDESAVAQASDVSHA